ncbi:replication protein [Marinilactibacillus piezotolerans]|uniref:replication protein n=1 Tax=Marinilactibacillus piezotolerans TaxID=258723 RepID=UPI0009B0A93C|nr:replication protein [Marinilactibacillus piezotolerans]
MKKQKDKRSNKWAFILYQESAPENYFDVLEGLHVPFILSPWHDKDVNKETGEIKKAHKHGALYFDSLKSYSQVSELISEKLKSPKHVEVIMSPKGMYDYFVHAENPDKTQYNIEDIESGCGFDLAGFLLEQDGGSFIGEIIDMIEENEFVEFKDLVTYARTNNTILLALVMNKTYFFAKYLDSRRYKSERNRQIKGGGNNE